MANYSRRTMGLLRDILNQKARSFDHSTAKIVAYWKTTLFDIGVQTDVIDAMSSHSFFWTNVIPSLSERKLEDRYGHFGPLSAVDQADAVDKLMKFASDSCRPIHLGDANCANCSLPTVSYFQLVTRRIEDSGRARQLAQC